MGFATTKRLRGISTDMKADSSMPVGLDLNYGQLALIIFLSFLYLVIASLGIDMFKKCQQYKDNNTQKMLKNFLSYTLTIVLTVPCVLLILKFSGHKYISSIMIILFGILGIVGSSVVLKWATSCKEFKEDQSKKIYSIVTLVIYILAFIIGIVMMYKKYKNKPGGAQ